MKKLSSIVLILVFLLTVSLSGCSTTKQVLVSDGYSDENVGGHNANNDTTSNNKPGNNNSGDKDNIKGDEVVTSTIKPKPGETKVPTKGRYATKGTVTVAFNTFRPTDIEPMLDEFNKYYPNITINVDYYHSDGDDSKTYIANKSAAKNLPDVVFDDIAQLSLYASQGLVYPLTDYVKNDADFNYIPKYFIENYTYGNQLYGLPHQAYFTSTIINEDLLDELNLDLPKLNWTIEDFIQYCKKATTSTTCAIEELSYIEQYYAALYGGPGVADYGYNEKTRKFQLNGTLTKALQIEQELRSISGCVGSVMRNNGGGKDSDYFKKFGTTEAWGAFKSGKSLFFDINHGTYNYQLIEELGSGFDWTFWTFPQVSNAPGRMPVHVDHAWMTTGTKNADAAFEVLRFFTYSKEGNLARLNAYINADSGKYKLNLPYYTPTTYQPDVKTAYYKLMGQKGKNAQLFKVAKYQYDNMEKCVRGDINKYTPYFSQNWMDIAGATVNKMRDGGDFSGVTSLENKVTKAQNEYWADFEKKLAKVQKEFKK